MKTTKRTIAVIVLIFAGALHAETQTVTLLSDEVDQTCDSHCTLRDAIWAAGVSAGPSEIRFQRGLSGTITLTSDLEFFGDDTTINGPGPHVITISGDDQFIAMEITSGNDNGTVRGLTLRDGFREGTGTGAGLIVRGQNSTVENLRVIDNHNDGQAAGVYIPSGGTFRNIEISGNSSRLNTGLLVNGNRPVLIENVTVSNNTAIQQVGTFRVLTNVGQDVVIRYLTVANNTGGTIGGLISNPGGSTVVEASVFSGHSSLNDLEVSADTVINNSVIENLSGNITLGANNLTGMDPQLLPLGFISGSKTRVHRFAEDSIVFDHVDNGVGDPQCGGTVTSDQVGNPRPGGALCDAGAYEVRPGVLIDDGFE